jgi:hypothetical protein
LHKIYADFQGENPERPADFHSRSISVSDVIVLNWRGNISSHYVDGTGFAELPNFLGEETKQEPIQAAEQAKQDVIKPWKGQQIHTATDGVKMLQPPVAKGKISLLARLDEAKQQVAQNRQTGVNNTKEREV